MSRLNARTRREKRLQIIARRIEFLDKRIAEHEITGTSYDLAERAALVWAHDTLDTAIELGLIDDLEGAAE